MTTSKPSENETVRIIGDQSFLSCVLGISRFILDANVGFQFDSAGIVLRFYCTPNRAVQRTQLKLVGLTDLKFCECFGLQTYVSRVHPQDLFLAILASSHLFYVV